MKKIVCFILIIIPAISFSQKKIASRVYLYGDVKSQITNTTLVKFTDADPKTEIKTVKAFRKKGLNAISYNTVFIPGANYSPSEFNEKISKEGIKTIVYIKVIGESSATFHGSTTNAYASVYGGVNRINAQGSAYSSGTSSEYTTGISLQMEVFSMKNNFDKPSGVLIGEAIGNWGVMSSGRSISKKILGRMLDGLERQKAFE